MKVLAVSGVCLIIVLVGLSIMNVIPDDIAAYTSIFVIVALGVIAFIRSKL